ncbi:phage tail fiber protein [Streptomyces sp. BH105]|uniref:phage tail fiber protein n=1 Tax=Streptomyces sp. BH105 TaxID=3410408 RepID=UPI003CEEF54D
MPGYFTQAAEKSAIQFLTATSSTTSVPSITALRSYLGRLYQVQGLAGLADYLPVAFLNAFATQAKADASGAWLKGIIGSRTDLSGTFYLALLTTDPGRQIGMPAMAALEVAATGYTRQAVPFTLATSPASGGSGASNSTPVFFGPFTAPGGLGAVATHAALVTVPSGTAGSVLAVWQLDTPVSASQNENLVLSSGGLAVGLDSWQS